MPRAKRVSLFHGNAPVNGKLAKVPQTPAWLLPLCQLPNLCHSLTTARWKTVCLAQSATMLTQIWSLIGPPLTLQASNVTKTSKMRESCLQERVLPIGSLNLLATQIQKAALEKLSQDLWPDMTAIARSGYEHGNPL